MPNAYKYTTGTEPGTIKKGNTVLGVNNDVGYGPTSSTDFWNGYPCPTGGYVIYQKKVSGGPSIYAPNDDSELVSITKDMGGTGITTATDALQWLCSDNDILVTNFDYENIVTDGLIFNFDAGFVAGYPKGGTGCYDLSDNEIDGVLTNGPTFDAGGTASPPSIVFDGDDDFIEFVNITSSDPVSLAGQTTWSLDALVYSNSDPSGDSYQRIIEKSNNTSAAGGWGLFIGGASGGDDRIGLFVDSTGIFDITGGGHAEFDKWVHYCFTRNGSTTKLYKDGVFQTSTTVAKTVPSTTTGMRIGSWNHSTGRELNGKVAAVKVYNKELTADEALQNFNALTGRAGGTPTLTSEILIERIDTDVSNGDTYTLTNDVGDVNKAFIRLISSTDKSSGGPVGISSTGVGPDLCGVGFALTATDTITFYAPNTTSRKVILEVWRYTGDSGGNYEFTVRQRGNVSVSTSSTTASASISGLTDRNDAIPFYNGFSMGDTSASNWNEATLGCYINASDEIVFSRGNSTTTFTQTAYYEVVEFIGSSWSVGHGVSTNHDASAETITLNTDSTGSGGSTFDVGDWETAAIMEATMEGDTDETGLADNIAAVYPTSGSTTQVDFSVTDVDAAARNDGSGYVHVLKGNALVVKRFTTAQVVTEGSNSYGTALSLPTGTSASTPLTKMGLEWFPYTSGTGTAHARGRLVAKIADNSGYEIQHWVHTNGNEVRARYATIDLSGIS